MRRGRAGLVALVCVGLGACSSGDGHGRVLPTLAPTTSALTSPTPLSNPSTSAATPDGAAAFVRVWFEALNAAARSGQAAELRKISSPDCRACTAFANSIESIWRTGRIEGGVFTVAIAEAGSLDARRSAPVTVQYSVTATRQVDSRGKVLKSVPPLAKVIGDVTVVREADHWLLGDLVVRA